jgi:DNA repair ATPase RecN
LAGAHARHHARVEPTFLLLDEFLDFYTGEVQVAALERLQMVAEHAQIAIVSHSPLVVSECSRDWTITTLESPRRRGDSDIHCPIDLEVKATHRP